MAAPAEDLRATPDPEALEERQNPTRPTEEDVTSQRKEKRGVPQMLFSGFLHGSL